MLSDGRPEQPPVYLERLELIRSACQEEALRNLSHTEVSKFVLDRIFVCDKHKILFCQTPKVGNTQWKKVLIVLNGTWGSIVMGEGWVAPKEAMASPEKTQVFLKVLCGCFPVTLYKSVWLTRYTWYKVILLLGWYTSGWIFNWEIKATNQTENS